MMNSKKIDKSRFLVLFLAIIAYRILVDYIYENIICIHYSYQNYINDLSLNSLICSWIFLLTLCPLIVKTILTFNLSSNILSFFALLSIIPISSMIAYNNSYRLEFIFLNFLYWFLVLIVNQYLKPIRFRINLRVDYLHLIIAFILSLVVVLVSWYFTGFRLHFGLMDVYDLRLDAREFNFPFLIGYLNGAAEYILPIMFIYCLSIKNKTLSLFFFLIIALSFGIAGSKHIVFLLFISLIGFFFVKTYKISKLFIWLFIIILLFSIIEIKVFDTIFSTLFFSFRIMFIPSKLHYVYYEFFSTRELDYFRQSLFKWLLQSPYNDNIGMLMTEYETGVVTSLTSGRSNNGMFSDAYFNLGFIGILVFPFFLVVILKLLEGASKGLSPNLLFSITLSVFMSLLSLPLTVSLFSSGIIIMIIFLYSLPRNKVSNVSYE